MDYEYEYNARERVPTHPTLIDAWARVSASWRREAEVESNVSYGPGERNVLDIFSPEGEADDSASIVMVIHGGYWQALDKSYFSHMARGATKHGLTVAVPSYTLCPQVRVGDIVQEMRVACRLLWQRFSRTIVVNGHSAGGNLAASMLATDWPAFDPQLPANLVTAAQPISGVFDLEPLVGTSINENLGLDAEEARAASPIHRDPPQGSRLDAWVGADETSEFRRQSQAIAEDWRARGATTSWHAEVGTHHFTVIAPLADPGSPMTENLAALARHRIE